MRANLRKKIVEPLAVMFCANIVDQLQKEATTLVNDKSSAFMEGFNYAVNIINTLKSEIVAQSRKEK